MNKEGNVLAKSSLSRFGQLYTAAAAILFTSLMLTLLALFMLEQILDWTGEERRQKYSEYFIRESYELSTKEEIAEIYHEFDLMGELESYQFNPWTTFSERPFKGNQLNVEEEYSYPTRRTVRGTDAGSSKRELLVWMFGGSTMFGWGVSDRHTIPTNLQSLLQNALPDRSVHVVNHGHTYYTSSMEVSLFLALLRKEKIPDIVIFLDGLNDVTLISDGFEDPRFAFQAASGWEKRAAAEVFSGGISLVYSQFGICSNSP